MAVAGSFGCASLERFGPGKVSREPSSAFSMVIASPILYQNGGWARDPRPSGCEAWVGVLANDEGEIVNISKMVPGMTNVSSPLEGVATAGQPTEAELKKLAQAGYRAVVDLRTSQEDRGFAEPEVVREAGMEYINMPLEAAPGSFDEDAFDRFRGMMMDNERRPMLVHCGTAARVGALMIPYLILEEDMRPDEAVELARRIGPEKEALTNRALEYAESRRGA